LQVLRNGSERAHCGRKSGEKPVEARRIEMVRTGSVVTATFLVCAVILCYSAMAYGEGVPQITGAPSTIQDRQSVTIAGVNFGTKTQGPPLLWEDFEWGVDGDPISEGGWTHYPDGDSSIAKIAEISSTQSYSGTRSAYALLGSDKGRWRGGYKSYTPSSVVYASYMLRWTAQNVVGNDNWKAGRITASTGGGVYSPRPKVNLAVNLETGWWRNDIYTDNGTYYRPNHQGQPKDAWRRVEFLYIMSDPPGATNGHINTWVNLQESTNHVTPVNGVTRSSSDAPLFDTYMTLHMGSSNPPPYEVWSDDIYVDNTRARVEIGNASTWATCTERVIQVPTTWSSDSITLTVNQASFRQGETAYLYVVDENGSVNENGFEIRFAEGGPDTTAPYPAYHSPTKGATDVPIDANISFHVIDSGAGVERSSIVMTVGGQTVQPVITGSPADYTVTYDPPSDFGYNQTVTVTIDAKDLASPPNAMRQEVYSFTTARQLASPGKPVHVD
jgi:hypothetical protein